MFVFHKIWCFLFLCYHRFKIRLFAFLAFFIDELMNGLTHLLLCFHSRSKTSVIQGPLPIFPHSLMIDHFE